MRKKRNWRGFANFNITSGVQSEALMTVCPGNPDQEGRRFRAVMEAAGAKLERLYIIEASDLGYHNQKLLVQNEKEARRRARQRGVEWLENHQEDIDRYMAGRCSVIPMREIVKDQTHQDRIDIIRSTYERGNNPVTDWFDYSIKLDLQAKGNRVFRDGQPIAPEEFKECSLGYLCEEYSMRSLMWQQFQLPEIYLGLAVSQHDLFQSQNTERPDIDMTIPQVSPITLKEIYMVHVKSIGNAVPAEGQDIPAHAKDFGVKPRRG